MDGERIAAIYRELGYPGAAKFQTALRKQGINVSLGNLRDLIKTRGSRQIFRPPPKYHVCFLLTSRNRFIYPQETGLFNHQKPVYLAIRNRFNLK